MAKLRRNNERASGGGLISKGVVFAGIIGALFYLFNMMNGGDTTADAPKEDKGQRVEIEFSDDNYITGIQNLGCNSFCDFSPK